MAAIPDGASSISVTVRVRPFTIREAAQLTKCDDAPLFLGDGSLAAIPTPKLAQKGIRPVIKVVDDKCLIFDPPEDNPILRFSKSVVPNSGKRVKDQTFGFDRVFDENTTQADVYEATTRGLLDSVLDGYNATVFAYGATGCGKTHTITGTTAHPGIIFLTMQELFERINERSEDKHTEVSLSYLEIYNETIRDLLAPPGSKGGLMLREDANQAVSVAGLSSHNPQNVKEVMEMIVVGNELRTVNPTEANATSSRSHAVLQINVSQKDRNADVNEPHTMATLSIIDLAGSERASATKNRGDRLLEGANINKSLLALGSCINALCDPRKKNHVPYRNSKLTRLLKFSLGGNCKTVMIVCVSPSSQHFDETQNTLRYANRAKNIQTKVTRNVYNVNRHVKDFLKKIDEQMALINELKAQNKDHEGMAMMKFKKQSEKKMAIAKDGIARLRAAYEHSGQERQERTNNMRRLRQVERRISILSSWVASFDHLCDGLDNGEDDVPTNLNAMRRTAQGVLAELEGSRQHFHQRLAKGNWERAIDSALQTGIRQLTDVDGCTDGTEIATLTREAELLKSNAEREAHTSVMGEEKGVEASIVQGLLSAHFETISSLHRILSMDEAGAIQAARQILMKVLASCSNATSQLVKPDVNATPCIPYEAYPPSRHGTPKRKKQASYFVEPSPLRGMINAPSLYPRLAPSAMGSLIPSSPLKSSPRRHHRRPPILSHKKGITFPPTPTRSRATKAGGLLPGGKRAVRWRDDTENGTLAEFQATPPPPTSDPSTDESPSEREEMPMVPEHAYLKLVGHLPPPSSTQPIDPSTLSSAADINSSPIPIAPETTVVGEWHPALTVLPSLQPQPQPQPQPQQDGSRDGRAVRGSRFRTGFLSKKSDGSPAPPAPPRRTNLSSDSETSPGALRELEPSRAGNRGVRTSQSSKEAMSSSSSPEMMAEDDIARVRKAMRRVSSVGGGGRERSSLVHRRRSPTASSSISGQIGRARSNSPTEDSTKETGSREGGELFGSQGKMFGSGHARRMVRSEKENYFGGGALTPRGTGTVVKSGGSRRMTVGEAGAKVGGMMGGLRVDSGRMSAILGSGGGMRNSGSGKAQSRLIFLLVTIIIIIIIPMSMTPLSFAPPYSAPESLSPQGYITHHVSFVSRMTVKKSRSKIPATRKTKSRITSNLPLICSLLVLTLVMASFSPFMTRLLRPFTSSTRSLTPESNASIPLPPGTQRATLAAGCFWGVEHLFRRQFPASTPHGIISTAVGYIGGDTSNPSYRAVCTGRTNHAEALQITFDPEKVTYRQLLEYFFKMHDPTTKDRQGGDTGTQYRSAIFTEGEEQARVAKEVRDKVQKEWWRNGSVVTEIIPAGQWWDAETYHQKYLDKNPGGYECPAHYARTFAPLSKD